MAKEIARIAKLEFLAGQAKPGPELAGLGIIMPEFTKQFNDDTKDRGQEPVPVTITVYNDKSFTFKTHTAPASYMLKQAGKIKSGSPNSKTTKVATIKKEDLEKIAEYKMPDMNTDSVEAAMMSIAGTAKNMGILIEGIDDIEAEKAKAAAATKEVAAAAAREDALAAAEAEALENKEKDVEVETSAQKAPEESEEDKEDKKDKKDKSEEGDK